MALSCIAMWQDTVVAASANDMHWIRIFIGVAAVGLVLQCVALCVAGIVAAVYGGKLLKRADDIADQVDKKISPLLNQTTSLINELSPRVRAISENVEQVSYTVRAKVDELADTVDQLNKTVQEVNARTRVQVVKVDGLVSEALDTTRDVSRTVQEGIRKPARQVAGVVAGLKAGFETLAAKSPFGKKGVGEPGPYDL